jgi:hypothetical protein
VLEVGWISEEAATSLLPCITSPQKLNPNTYLIMVMNVELSTAYIPDLMPISVCRSDTSECFAVGKVRDSRSNSLVSR